MGIVAAYGFDRFRFRGGKVMFFMVVASIPMSIGSSSILIPTYMYLSKLGMVDKWYTLPILYTLYNLPMAIWILKGSFEMGAPLARRCGPDRRLQHLWRAMARRRPAGSSGYRQRRDVPVYRSVERLPLRLRYGHFDEAAEYPVFDLQLSGILRQRVGKTHGVPRRWRSFRSSYCS